MPITVCPRCGTIVIRTQDKSLHLLCDACEPEVLKETVEAGIAFLENRTHTHTKTSVLTWPDGGAVEVCECGMSRHIWEQGESEWIMVENLEEARAQLQDLINKATGEL